MLTLQPACISQSAQLTSTVLKPLLVFVLMLVQKNTEASSNDIFHRVWLTHQIGCYFGAELCSFDVNSDGNTDFLLVGAPLFYHPQERREGQIHVYRLTEEVSLLWYTFNTSRAPFQWTHCSGFFEQMQLQSEVKLSVSSMGRFGTTITSVADLNGDGLRDIAVGAPLEDENRGAVYIFLGDGQKGIRSTFIQVGQPHDTLLAFGWVFLMHKIREVKLKTLCLCLWFPPNNKLINVPLNNYYTWLVWNFIWKIKQLDQCHMCVNPENQGTENPARAEVLWTGYWWGHWPGRRRTPRYCDWVTGSSCCIKVLTLHLVTNNLLQSQFS